MIPFVLKTLAVVALTVAPQKTKSAATTVIEIKGEITPNMAQIFALKLSFAQSPVQIQIDTPGGSATASSAIAESIIAAAKTKRIECLVTGDALSGGLVVLQGCPKRIAAKTARFMAHQPYFMMPDRVTATILIDLQRWAAEAEGEYVSWLARRFKISYAEILERIRNREWWMTPEEALEVGAIDAIQ